MKNSLFCSGKFRNQYDIHYENELHKFTNKVVKY